MDPIVTPLLTLAVGYLGGRVLKALIEEPEQPNRSGKNEVRRIGDATIDAMRRTSSDFRQHIDRETRR